MPPLWRNSTENIICGAPCNFNLPFVRRFHSKIFKIFFTELVLETQQLTLRQRYCRHLFWNNIPLKISKTSCGWKLGFVTFILSFLLRRSNLLECVWLPLTLRATSENKYSREKTALFHYFFLQHRTPDELNNFKNMNFSLQLLGIFPFLQVVQRSQRVNFLACSVFLMSIILMYS